MSALQRETLDEYLLTYEYLTEKNNRFDERIEELAPVERYEEKVKHIISKDIFLRVQEELVRRQVVKTSANGKKRSYSCNHCFAQIIVCGDCGEMFRRIHWNNRGCKSIVWCCLSRLKPTGQECHARTVNETVLENVELQKELLKKANNKKAYDEIADQIFKFREQREKCTVNTAARDAQISRINDLQDYIKKQHTDLSEFNETSVKRWLKQIIVWDDHFTAELKSRLKIDIEG